jgi:hypothetical protein
MEAERPDGLSVELLAALPVPSYRSSELLQVLVPVRAWVQLLAVELAQQDVCRNGDRQGCRRYGLLTFEARV